MRISDWSSDVCSSDLLVSQALALAGQEESPLDVAAGNDALGGGGRAYDDNLGSILDLLIAQGVIPPTALQFGLIDLEDDPVGFNDEADGDRTGKRLNSSHLCAPRMPSSACKKK